MKKEKVVLKSIGYFLYFLFASIISCIAVLIYKVNTDISWVQQIYDALLNDDMKTYLKLVLVITPAALILADILIIVPFIIIKIKNKEQIIKKIGITNTSLMLSIGLFLNLVVTLCVTYIPFPESWQQDLSMFTNVAIQMPPVLTVLCTGILAPIMEEIIFRYGVFNKLKQKNVTMALIVSSILFGLMHGNIIQGGYAFILGFIIAYIYNKTNNLLDPILIHIGVNLSSVIFTFTNFNEIIYLLSLTIIFTTITFFLQKNKPFKIG